MLTPKDLSSFTLKGNEKHHLSLSKKPHLRYKECNHPQNFTLTLQRMQAFSILSQGVVVGLATS
jgi:hypothetical protein